METEVINSDLETCVEQIKQFFRKSHNTVEKTPDGYLEFNADLGGEYGSISGEILVNELSENSTEVSVSFPTSIKNVSILFFFFSLTMCLAIGVIMDIFYPFGVSGGFFTMLGLGVFTLLGFLIVFLAYLFYKTHKEAKKEFLHRFFSFLSEEGMSIDELTHNS